MVKGFIGYDETQRRIRVIEEQREQKEDSAYEYLIIHEQVCTPIYLIIIYLVTVTENDNQSQRKIGLEREKV